MCAHLNTILMFLPFMTLSFCCDPEFYDKEMRSDAFVHATSGI
ncbi:hypothetical protein JCM19240_3473 [Vibrio maritimus]|uniref:Uncharacterized protein n=1 Tax=Vibrio maritimus TaxID=990268 RepID=A0A090T7B5_9VIBR|nr:hypothetical protein JCM19240_3473 [Vibrio maritimus]